MNHDGYDEWIQSAFGDESSLLASGHFAGSRENCFPHDPDVIPKGSLSLKESRIEGQSDRSRHADRLNEQSHAFSQHS